MLMGGGGYKICVSEPARSESYLQVLDVLKYLKHRFQNAHIYFVLHRKDKNIKTDNFFENMLNQVQIMQVKIIDISYSAEGFRVYDDCNLHIGYRVHAHIYNLSRNNVSLLIEEDGRGAGVNDALGIPHIRSYEFELNCQNVLKSMETSCKNIIKYVLNVFCKKHFQYGKYSNHSRKPKSTEKLIQELSSELDFIIDNNYLLYDSVFARIRIYYENMIVYIKSFADNIKKYT